MSAVPPVGPFASSDLQFASVVWEALLGVVLLSGVCRPLAWGAAVVTFALFAAVSGYLGWQGVARCGCFGAIPASPWHALVVDLLVLVALIIVRPEPSACWQAARRACGPLARTACGVAVLLLLAAAAGWARYGSVPAALAVLRGEPLVAPRYLDFGVGAPGESHERPLPVTNWTDRPVHLIGGTSDCSCVTTADLPTTLAPGETKLITVRLTVPAASAGHLTRAAEVWTDCERQRVLQIRLGCLIATGP